MIRLFDKILNRIFYRAQIYYQESIYNSYRRKFNLSDSFRFNGKDILMYGDGEIFAGSNSYVGDYSTWQSSKGYKIEIGEGCMISYNVRCFTRTNVADYDFSFRPKPPKMGNVKIGNYVWIGANVFINPGIIIGDNAIKGANSVLTKYVEDFAIVGGVPAKFIRY